MRIFFIIALYLYIINISGCASFSNSRDIRHAPAQKSPNTSRCQTTYEVNGKSYCVLQSSRGFRQKGAASWYGSNFHGKATASGKRYDQNKMTAAHKTLPFGTRVKVINTQNKRSVIVKITDRGPFHKGRIIDLSRSAARKLGIKGVARVSIKAI